MPSSLKFKSKLKSIFASITRSSSRGGVDDAKFLTEAPSDNLVSHDGVLTTTRPEGDWQSRPTIRSPTRAARATTAFNVAKITLSLAESVGEAIPMAGDPLRAAVGGILKILELFDTKSKNKNLATRLSRKLQDLEKRIEQPTRQGNYGEMSQHLEQLTHQLQDLHVKLKAAQEHSNSGWLSVLNGSSIADDLRECGDDIAAFLEGYNFSVTTNIENHVVALSAKLSEFEPEKLTALLQSYYLNASIHSPLKETLPFIDARGKRMEVSLTCCYSYEVFQAYLAREFGIGSDSPRRGATYVESGQYVLTFEANDISANRPADWSKMLVSGRPLEMFIILVEPERFSNTERCPRCNALLPEDKNQETQLLYCISCDLDCHSDYEPREVKQEGHGDLDFFSKFRLVCRDLLQVVSAGRQSNNDAFSNEIKIPMHRGPNREMFTGTFGDPSKNLREVFENQEPEFVEWGFMPSVMANLSSDNVQGQMEGRDSEDRNGDEGGMAWIKRRRERREQEHREREAIVVTA